MGQKSVPLNSISSSYLPHNWVGCKSWWNQRLVEPLPTTASCSTIQILRVLWPLSCSFLTYVQLDNLVGRVGFSCHCHQIQPMRGLVVNGTNPATLHDINVLSLIGKSLPEWWKSRCSLCSHAADNCSELKFWCRPKLCFIWFSWAWSTV